MARFKKELKEVFGKFAPIKGEVALPYFGKAGLLGIFKTEDDKEFLAIRQKIHHLWYDLRLPLGLPQKYYDLAYLSLTRYTGKFTQPEKEVLKNLPKQKISGVILAKVFLILNDKFMTPKDTKVLKKFDLELKGQKLTMAFKK